MHCLRQCRKYLLVRPIVLEEIASSVQLRLHATSPAANEVAYEANLKIPATFETRARNGP